MLLVRHSDVPMNVFRKHDACDIVIVIESEILVDEDDDDDA